MRKKELAKVCSGLASVCVMLRNDVKDVKLKKRFDEQKKVFRAFAKIFRGEVK